MFDGCAGLGGLLGLELGAGGFDPARSPRLVGLPQQRGIAGSQGRVFCPLGIKAGRLDVSPSSGPSKRQHGRTERVCQDLFHAAHCSAGAIAMQPR